MLGLRGMTAPRPVFPGQFLFITRRCTQRQFLMRPDDETNNTFVYCMAEAAKRFDIDVILPQMMSNHQHSAVWDGYGNHVEFREHFHKLFAKAMNALRGRWENFWASEEPCVVEVVTRDALMDKLVYIATNPVKGGLVERVHHWPGPNFISALLKGRPLRARRPRHFFRTTGKMPKEVELLLKLPDHMVGKAEFLDELRQRVAAVEAEHAAKRRATGKRVLGRQRVLQQSWRDSPITREPRRNVRPRVATRNKWARIETLQRNAEWQAEYREARKRLVAGTPTKFPYGTYWLARFADVPVRPPRREPVPAFS